jgi:hypothetical protein
MPEEAKGKEESAKGPSVTGGPPPQDAAKAARRETAPQPEIPQPDISQPGKTVHRANKLLDERQKANGKGKKGKAKKGKKSDVPKLFADGLNDQEVADVTGFNLDEVREQRQNPWGHKGPREVKPHKSKLTPKSQLPKDYKHPVDHPKKAQVLKPSEFGKAREEEVEAAKPENQAKKREQSVKKADRSRSRSRARKTPRKTKRR